MPKLYSPTFAQSSEFTKARAQLRAALITAYGHAPTDRVRLTPDLITLEGQTEGGDWQRITNSTSDMPHYLKSNHYQMFRLSAPAPAPQEVKA